MSARLRVKFLRPAGALVLVGVLAVALSGSRMPAAQAQPAGSVRTVQQAYQRLLANYIDPLAPDQILNEAWNGAVAAAIVAGVDSVPSLPALPADDRTAWTAFATAFDALVSAAGGRIGEPELAFAAVDAMATARDECHTYFLRPERYRDFIEQAQGRGSYAGIGVQISTSAPRTITVVFPHTPAEQAGLLPGDILQAVDGVPVAELTGDSLSPHIRGPEGTSLKLTILRPPETEPRDIVVVRAIISIPVLSTTLRPDGVAVLTLTIFADNGLSETQLRQALIDLEAKGATGWVLDLRGNSGGLVTSVQRVLGLFLPAGTPAATFVDRSGGRETRRVIGPRVTVQRPLAVVVGPGSASGAEISAAALQDAGRARTFGQRTAGCANSGQLFELPGGAAMLITANRVLSGPRERPLDGAGLTPDEEVAGGPGDAALEAAVSYLKSGAPVQAPVETP